LFELVKKSYKPSGSIKIFKKFPLKFLYEDVKGANRILPRQLIRDNL